MQNQAPKLLVAKNRLASGFTLIELLVITALLGLLASIAMSSYDNYVTSTRIASVQSNYAEAVRVVRSQFVAAEANLASGINPAAQAPDSVEGWVNLMNPLGTMSPGGSPAYEEGLGNSVTGSIGIVVTGAFANGNLQLTLTRPAYFGQPMVNEVISQS